MSIPATGRIKDKKASVTGSLFCREEATRTPDPYVPNVVRYQLRYFSIKKSRIVAALRVSNSDNYIKKVC